MELDKARNMAQGLVELLRPACSRICIAGSIRREKPDVKDIEIVAIADHYHLSRIIERAINDRVLAFNPGDVKNGMRYKKLVMNPVHEEQGMALFDNPTVVTSWEIGVDLFLCNADNWGNIFAIRTGSADFTRELVTLARRRCLEQRDGYLWRTQDGEQVVCTEESDYFDAIGAPLIPPQDRNEAGAARLRSMIGWRA